MDDADLINTLGGPAKVARLLGFEKFGVQRVQNWITRGIPAQVKLDHPELFLAYYEAKRKGRGNERATASSAVTT